MRTCLAILALCLLPPIPAPAGDDGSSGSPITHTVFFTLEHEKGSSAEAAFRKKTMALADIPGVQDLRWLVETSPKNDFDYGLSMRFADEAAYEAYAEHPDHVQYVEEIWIPNVADFLEIDYREEK